MCLHLCYVGVGCVHVWRGIMVKRVCMLVCLCIAFYVFTCLHWEQLVFCKITSMLFIAQFSCNVVKGCRLFDIATDILHNMG